MLHEKYITRVIEKDLPENLGFKLLCFSVTRMLMLMLNTGTKYSIKIQESSFTNLVCICIFMSKLQNVIEKYWSTATYDQKELTC